MKDSNTDAAVTLLDLIAVNDSCPYEPSFFEPLYQLYIPNDDRPHGYLVPNVVKKIPWTSNFQITHETRRVDILDSSNGQDTSAAVNAAFAGVVNACLERDLFNLKARIYEEFTVVGVPYPVRLYRFAAALFGIISQGAHLTVYTRTPSGMKIWVPRRSPTIATYPNKLDSTVAGGVSAGTTPFETIVREAEEEASLPGSLVRRDIQPTGVLTYVTLLRKGQGEFGGLVKPDMVHVYDMEVAEDVIPKPHDDEVKEALLRKEFKTNSAAVFIDFFIRQ